MIVRVTNRCTMGCSHCAIDASGPDGAHMDWAVFRRACAFAAELAAGSHFEPILISGGEPFEHPEIFDLIESLGPLGRVLGMPLHKVVLSNGRFLEVPEVLARVVRMGVLVQVTRDPRFYPAPMLPLPRLANVPTISVTTEISRLIPCRRTRAAGFSAGGVPNLRAPSCFNLRSLTRGYGLREALRVMRAKLGRFCVPSVDVDGTVRAGETDTCVALGTVDSPVPTIEDAVANLRCNRCGSLANLSSAEREAIGETP